MNTLLNVLWLLLGGGFWLGVSWLLSGAVLCLTVVGIPFGVASFRVANYVFWPFGRDLVPAQRAGGPRSGGVTLAVNVLWFVLFGLWLAAAHVLAAAGCFLSVVGIPFGLAHAKIAAAAVAPLGKRVVSLRGHL
ncbi:MAG: YccF domain-containing protein [Planctomycetes bacterium]|jgi:uncharacterized membrane protein YccF (DUF307 family)|nr:YccF domain-containing protein [Planctomycetota bacterium]